MFGGTATNLTLSAATSSITGFDPTGTLTVQGTVIGPAISLNAGTGGIALSGTLNTDSGSPVGGIGSIFISTPGPVTQSAGSIYTGAINGTAATLLLPQASNQITNIGNSGTGAFTTTVGGLTIVDNAALTVGKNTFGVISTGIAVPAGQTIALQTDQLTLLAGGTAGSRSISAPGGTFAIQPLGANRTTVITTSTKPGGSLALTTGELGLVTAAVLQVGGASTAGNISFGQPSDGTIDLVANGNFAQVAVSTTGTVGQNAPLNVNALSGTVLTLNLPNAANSIPSVTSISASGITLTTAGNLTISGSVFGSATVSITSGGTLTLAATGGVTGSNGLALAAGAAGGLTGGMSLAGSIGSNRGTTLNAGTDGIALSGTVSPGQVLQVGTTGPLTQTGGAITGGNLVGNASSISLPSRSNAFNQVGSSTPLAATDAAGDVLLVTSVPLTIGTSPSTSGGLQAQSGRTITVVTDKVTLLDATTGVKAVSATNGTFVLSPFTLGGAILLTASKPATGLSLSTAELAQIGVGTLQLGMLSGGVPTAGAITLGSSGDSIDLGIAGINNLQLVSSGAVTQGGTLTVYGVLDGQSASLSLPSANNYIRTLGSYFTSTGDITLTSSGGLTVSGPVVAAGGAGNISLTATGQFTESFNGPSMSLEGNVTGNTVTLNTINFSPSSSGGIQQPSGILTANTLLASAYDISLPQANQVTNLGTSAAYAAFTLNDARPLLVTGAVSSATAALTLTTQGLTQLSTSSVSAPELDGSATTDTVLTSRLNAIAGMGTYTQSAGNFSLVTSSPVLTFGYNTGVVSAPAGSLSFVADQLGLVPSPPGGTAITSANLVSFSPFTANRRIELIGTTASDANSLSVTQPLISLVTTTRLSLGDANSTGAMNIANAAETIDLTGHATTLQLQTTGTVTEGISPAQQNGGGTLALKVGNLTGSVGDLTLTAPANAIATLGAPDGLPGEIDGLAAAQSLRVQSSLALTVGNSVTANATTGTLSIGSGASLQATGALAGGTVVLTAAGGALSQTAGTIVASNTLTLNAPGSAISQTGGTISAATLSGNGTSASLTSAGNMVATLGSFTTTGNLSLVDAQALSVAGPVTAGSATLNVTGALSIAGALSTSGTLSLLTTGAITEPGGTVTAGTLTGNGPSAALTGGANNVATLGAFATTGAFALTDSRNLTVNGPVNGNSVALADVGGSLTLAGTIAAPTTVSLSATGAITQPGGSISAGTLTANANNATLGSAGNGIVTLGTVTTTGGFILTDAQSLTVNGPFSAASASLSVTGNLALAGTVTVPGTLTLSPTGTLLQPGGSMTVGTLTGSAGSAALGSATNAVTTLGAFTTTGAFTLVDGRALTVSGPLSASAATLSVTGGLTLAAPVTTSGPLTLAATGAINQTAGAITAPTLTGSAASAAFGSAGNAVTGLGAFTTTGSFALTDSVGLSVAGPVSTGSASFSVTGGLTLAGPVSATGALSLIASGAITEPGGPITAGTLSGSAANAALGNAANAVATLGGFTTTGAFSLVDGQNLNVSGPLSASSATLNAAGTLALAGA